jgi:uncharacterized membrane protein
MSRDVDDPQGKDAPEHEGGPAAADGGGRPGGATVEHLQARLQRIERRLEPEVNLFRHAEKDFVLPAWRRVTRGEPRWPVSVAILAAVAMQLALPSRVALHPRGLLPGLEAVLLVGLVVANPRRIDRESPPLRAASMVLIAVMSLANAFSAARLVIGLVGGTEGQAAGPLLITGAGIWLTNVVVFSLWYWDLDRGGPVARAHATHAHPDFLFPQMQSPELAPSDWEPGFVDYLYLSFTNATAFSPTDVLPLSRWAKLTMMLQSAVSLATVALVIARAVNILK